MDARGGEVDGERAARAVRELLAALGEDPDREGLRETPGRVAEAWALLFSGLREEPAEHLSVAFDEGARDLVIVRDLPVASICEHHLLPMQGKAHVAYLPDGRVAGFSEIARLVEGYARRPQLQERLTAQVAGALHDEPLGSRGSFVVLHLVQSCMTMREPGTTGSTTVTSAARGVFAQSATHRAEALSLISGYRT
jgi:GTP cyclohydrolase I